MAYPLRSNCLSLDCPLPPTFASPGAVPTFCEAHAPLGYADVSARGGPSMHSAAAPWSGPSGYGGDVNRAPDGFLPAYHPASHFYLASTFEEPPHRVVEPLVRRVTPRPRAPGDPPPRWLPRVVVEPRVEPRMEPAVEQASQGEPRERGYDGEAREWGLDGEARERGLDGEAREWGLDGEAREWGYDGEAREGWPGEAREGWAGAARERVSSGGAPVSRTLPRKEAGVPFPIPPSLQAKKRISTSKRCEAEGCPKQPSFGERLGAPRTRCGDHAPPGWPNVKNKRCDTPEGCPSRPTFGFPGHPARRCAGHAELGMADVMSKTCEFEGCPKLPSYGILGGKRQYCAPHAPPGMVDVKTKRCYIPGCGAVSPTWGPPGGPRRVCPTHAGPGDVNLAVLRGSGM